MGENRDRARDGDGFLCSPKGTGGEDRGQTPIFAMATAGTAATAMAKIGVCPHGSLPAAQVASAPFRLRA